MSLTTLSVNFTAAQVNVKKVQDVAESLFGVYEQLSALYEGDLDSQLHEVFLYEEYYAYKDHDWYELMRNKLIEEARVISTSAHHLLAIADRMQRTVDLFREDHLEEIRMSSAGVHEMGAQTIRGRSKK